MAEQPSTLSSPPTTPRFPRCPGETPRAFNAFIAYFQLGRARSHQLVVDKLGESLGTIKNWSSRFNWNDRIAAFESGLLEQQANEQAEAQRKEAADWARREAEHREQEWAASQKLLVAANCFLESFGDQHVEKMTLGQASRALLIASKVSRLALSGATGSEPPATTPLQLELAAALNKAYGDKTVSEAKPVAPNTPQSTTPSFSLREENHNCRTDEPLSGWARMRASLPTPNSQPSTQASLNSL